MYNITSVRDINGVRYELDELLGRGGQGAVYSVKGGRLAVKLIAGKQPLHRDRMRNQLTHVRRLPISDLRLAKPLEMLQPPHTGYVMELLSGMTPLKVLLAPAKGKPPSVEWYRQTGGLRRRLLVLAHAAHTLAQLHGKGLAYSDPSPSNIFISDDASFTEVRFIDTDNLRYESSPGSLAGVYTPGYGAPELVQGCSGVTTLTDVHAFAVIAFQALSLAHPFIGDLVNDGEPELEEQAFGGFLPWIHDTQDDRNHASFGVPRAWVLSSRLADAFQRTFGAGRIDPSKRPSAAEWAERLFAAADATIVCAGCSGSYYFNQRHCPWCDVARPTLATAEIFLWDPVIERLRHQQRQRDLGGTLGELSTEPDDGLYAGTGSRRRTPKRVGHGAVATGTRFIVTRRHAFNEVGVRADEAVLEASLTESSEISIRALDGKSYRLVSATGARETIVSDRPQRIRLAAEQRSWRVHFGRAQTRHRVLDFCLHPGSEP